MRALVAVFQSPGSWRPRLLLCRPRLAQNAGACSSTWAPRSFWCPSPRDDSSPRQMAVGLVGGAVLWQAYPVAIGLQAAAQVEASNEDYWYPVEAFLAETAAPTTVSNIVSTDHHWEAFFLARRGVPLTRGWYRQDDFPINSDLYANELTATRSTTPGSPGLASSTSSCPTTDLTSVPRPRPSCCAKECSHRSPASADGRSTRCRTPHPSPPRPPTSASSRSTRSTR